MRNALIVVSLLCVILAVSFFKVRSNAAGELEAAQKEISGLSNKVTEVQTRMVMGQALTADATNKMRAQIEQESKVAAGLSNQLAQARLAGASLREQLEGVQANLAKAAARVEELEAGLQDANSRVEQAKSGAGQLIQAQNRLAAVTAERDKALQESQSLRLAKADLDNQLQNAAFLRSQLERVEQQARLSQKAAKQNLSQFKDPKAPLQLQSDGSVRVLTSTNSPATAGVSAPRR